MTYTPTKEQELIVAEVSNGDGRIVLVDAVAGSGKSSTARLVVNTIRPKRGLYTAFNKAIVEEGRELFPTNIECRTLHSLALSYVKPKLSIEPFTYLCVKEKLSYPDKYKVIQAMDEFYRSNSIDVYEFMVKLLDKKLATIAVQYVEQMFEDKIPPTFNFLLKYFHLLLAEDQIDPGYDMVILDECQDSTAVALEIFKLLTAKHKMGLGDQFQAIYGFMNLVNGFKILEDQAVILSLTKSFRCHTSIATKVETFGKHFLHEDFKFIGTDTPEKDGKTAYITATNSAIIKRLIKLHDQKQGYILTRPLKDIFACPLALVTASAGKPVLHKQYKFLDKEYKNYTMSNYKSFYTYLNQETKDEEIKNSVNLLNHLRERSINIFDVLAKAKAIKKDRKITVGTYFSLKGLGFETVHIEPDLNGAVENAIEALEDGELTDAYFTHLKGFYVACTRARVSLINAVHLKEV